MCSRLQVDSSEMFETLQQGEALQKVHFAFFKETSNDKGLSSFINYKKHHRIKVFHMTRI